MSIPRRLRAIAVFASVAMLLSISIGCTAPVESGDPSTEEDPLKNNEGGPLLPNEPAYCLPATFYRAETATMSGLERAHQFRLGDVTIVGLGVGDTNVSSTLALARTNAPSLAASDKSCTFYYNDGNDDAQRAFNWHPLPKPTGSDFAAMVAEYNRLLGDVFDTAQNSFLSCARKGYVAMGCDGMRHRGPSVWAMFLAYSGCSPEHAVAIANHVWDKNGIKPEMRLELARSAQRLAASPGHAEHAQELRSLLEGEK